MEKNEWIPDGFQIVELLQEHRDNLQQQGILFDDDETREAYDKLIAEGNREMLPAIKLVADLFGNVKIVDVRKATELIEIDIVPDGSNEATENDGRESWIWSSQLSDRSIWLQNNYENLDEKNPSCDECYIEYSKTGQCNCA